MQFKVKGIISYPHLFTPRAIEAGKDPKYSTTVLILKTDPQVAQIQAIIEQEKANGWPSGFPAAGKIFMKDCAVAFPEQPEVHGYMAVTGSAKADQKPAVVDMNMQPVIDPSQVYAGSIAWVAFNSYTYDQTLSKGVTCGLNAVMVTGEESELGRLDGKPSVESLFADVAEGLLADKSNPRSDPDRSVAMILDVPQIVDEAIRIEESNNRANDNKTGGINETIRCYSAA